MKISQIEKLAGGEPHGEHKEQLKNDIVTQFVA